MNLLFKNKTMYTTKIYEQFIIFHTKLYGLKEDLATIFITLMLAILSISLFYSHYPIQGLLFVGVTIGFLIWRFYRPSKVIQKQKKSIEKNNQNTTSSYTTYYFYPDYFVVSYQKQYSKVKYRKLYKAYETSDFFYLYYDKEHTFLIDKSCFSVGDSSSFSKFIKEKLKRNFDKQTT
ncbi:MAG: YcxB family protein [Clostridia bacterium]